MKSDLRKRSKNKYCRFHHDHGYDTHECYDLKQKIEALIKHGKLKHFIGQEQKDERQSLKNDPRVRVEEPPQEEPLLGKGDCRGINSMRLIQ